MGEALVDKARRLQQVAGQVQAVKSALQDAKRLQNRASELRKALTEPDIAAQTWRACASAGVPHLATPAAEKALAQAVFQLQRGLESGTPPAELDAAFEGVKHALTALRRDTDGAIAQAWLPFARATAEEAGLRFVRKLPPTTRQAVSGLVEEVEQAAGNVPRNPNQVNAFTRHVNRLRQQIGDVRDTELPTELAAVFEALDGPGFPLRELTADQLRLLQSGGFAEDIVVRWRG